MRSRTRSRTRALALAALCGMPFAAAAQIPGGAPVELTREQVLELETALAQLNFDPGKIDGVIDERTRAAIRLYQDFAALPADSEVTPALLAEVLSVARSFAEMRSKRAADPTPDSSSDAAAEAPAEPQAPLQEPVPPKSVAKTAPDEVPSDIPAQASAEPPPPAEPSGAASDEAAIAEPPAVPPAADSRQAVEPERAPPQAAQAPPDEPSAEVAIAEPPAAPPSEPPATPAADSGQAVEPEDAPPQSAQAPRGDAGAPAKIAEPPEKPKIEPTVAEQSPPKPLSVLKDPGPRGKKPAPATGFNIGNVISRLVETGKKADKLAEPGSAAAPVPAPLSGPSGKGQLARVPAPAPAPALTPAPSPARTPDKPVDGYAAFQEAYKAGLAGDFEYAAKRYTDAIKSGKLTLEHLGDAHFNRANALHFLGRYDKSIEDYGVAIGAKPTFAGAYYNRGFAYQAKGDRERSVNDFHRARDLGLQRLGVRAPDRSPPLR